MGKRPTLLTEGTLVPLFYGLTLFLSAFLLFFCEPMVGKMVLPFLGGATSVWTTCVLFFQAMLLVGYAYAYFLNRAVGLRVQVLVHLVLMTIALAFLPIRFSEVLTSVSASEHPMSWLLIHLFSTAALPFAIASSTAPLLQNWLSKTWSSAGRDPYFLYTASNAGSLLALLMYPLFIEPRLGLLAQSGAWLRGFEFLILAVAVSAMLIWRPSARLPFEAPVEGPGLADKPTSKMRVFWLAATFVPSALMLAVTNHISANLVAAPFLWVIPMAVYLLTFMIAFARRNRVTLSKVSQVVSLLLLLTPYITVGAPVQAGLMIWIVLVAHIAILFSGALLCHTALAASRPHPRHLTEFYFWIALGGVLSGIFAVVVAPLIFRTVFEYPLLVAIVVFFRPQPDSSLQRNRGDWIYPSLIGLALIVAWFIFRSSASADTKGMTSVFVISGSFVIIYGFRERWFRFSLATAIFIIGSALILPSYLEEGQRLAVARDFFGVKKVLFDAATNTRKLLHGDTLHGMESLDPQKSGEPLSYYHTSGPAGDVMAMLSDRPDQHVAVIGLGTGSLAAYAGPQRHITFYDLDPQVPKLAREYFSFLTKCGAFCDVIVADGRLAITRAKSAEFDLLVVDAFNSDSIPPHLVSREAIAIYVSKLKPNGILLFHVSNRYLDIEKLVTVALLDSRLPAFVRRDEGDPSSGKSGSKYVAGARRFEDLGSISSSDKWSRVTAKPDVLPWTDDYSNVLSVVRWF